MAGMSETGLGHTHKRGSKLVQYARGTESKTPSIRFIEGACRTFFGDRSSTVYPKPSLSRYLILYYCQHRIVSVTYVRAHIDALIKDPVRGHTHNVAPVRYALSIDHPNIYHS